MLAIFLLFYKPFGPHRYLASTFQGLRRSKISIPGKEDAWVEYVFWPAHLGLTLRHSSNYMYDIVQWTKQVLWKDLCF